MTMNMTGRAAVATAVFASGAVVAPMSAIADDGEVVVESGESIQAAIDAAEPGSTIIVRGDHVENVWVNKSGISLIGQHGATITQPVETTFAPCDFFGPPGVGTTVCVYPPTEEFPIPEDQKLEGVTISGFEITNPVWDSIQTIGVRDVTISRNDLTSGCSGVFALFVEDFRIDRNTATGDNQCNGIDVAASLDGVVTRNEATDNGLNGIAINDSSDVVVSRNTATGNCQGIGAFDNPDPSDLPTKNVTITRNVATANTTVCYPFDPPGSQLFPVGGVGIIVAGTDNAVITRNSVTDHVIDEFSLSAAGILVTDFPSDPNDPHGDPNVPSSISTNTTVDRNVVTNNSSATGPADLVLVTLGNLTSVDRNVCGVSVPDPSWCSD